MPSSLVGTGMRTTLNLRPLETDRRRSLAVLYCSGNSTRPPETMALANDETRSQFVDYAFDFYGKGGCLWKSLVL
jgi:hypothetical protein